MSPVRFDKPPLSLAKQVALLQSRGMRVSDPLCAQDALLRINYYRFSGYALHFEVFERHERTHRFREGTTFEEVLSL